MEGEAVTRGRGPGARGGGGRWPARGVVSPGGPPAAARRRPAAVFVRGATESMEILCGWEGRSGGALRAGMTGAGGCA